MRSVRLNVTKFSELRFCFFYCGLVYFASFITIKFGLKFVSFLSFGRINMFLIKCVC